MLERKSSWIRGKDYTVSLVAGSSEGHNYQISISINSHSGKIKNGADRPGIIITDPQRTRLRHKDRHWFTKHCGRRYMKDKEVDHAWDSEIIWCRVTSPEENGGRYCVQSEFRASFIDTEEWVEELYPGERR